MDNIETINYTNSTKQSIFIEGSILIFKKWASFRMALDNNPEVLTQFSDDEDKQLEINEMLNCLFNDILQEMEKESGPVLEQNVADLIFCFVQEFFDVDLEDDSERQIAKNLIKLYNEIFKENKTEFIDRLRTIDKTFNYSNYSIAFPIIVQEKVLVKDFENKMKIDKEEDDEGFVVVKKGKKY
jgi:hypothetical protein